MDIAVQIRKISSSGTPLAHLNYPCPVPISSVPNVNTAKTLGPQGFLRASHAVTRDETLNTFKDSEKILTSFPSFEEVHRPTVDRTP